MSKFSNVARDAMITALLVSLTGCGGGGGSDNPQGSNPPPPAPAPAPSPRWVGTWQRYDTQASGHKWHSTADLDPNTTLCQIANPCQFSDLVAQMGANARVSFSLAVTKGRDNEFTGAVDAVRVNDTVYDFEPSEVLRSITATQ